MTSGYWYRACETFENQKVRMGRAKFLRSALSGGKLTGTRSEQGSFGQISKKYRNGKLNNVEMKIIRARNFEVIKHKLVQYLKL